MNPNYTFCFKRNLLLVAFFALLIITGINKAAAQSVSSNSNIAPSLIMGFTGEVNDNNGQLTWIIENETNIKWFVIERSGDGRNFDSIGMVTGINNAHHFSYSYTDTRLLSGSNYYRLREVDGDGYFRYSKWISLMNTAVSPKIKVFPNPASAVINYTISSSSADQVTVQIFNLAGVLVAAHQQQLSAGINQESIAISALKSGNYFLKVIDKTGSNQHVQLFAKI
ncbi:T9SS type A sorting domain-containing protein [Flavitalea flava]